MKSTNFQKRIFGTIVFTVSMFYVSATYAQCDTVAAIYQKNISGGFISDGQQYRSLLVNNEIAEFTTTFYGGYTYRIVAGSRINENNLVFRVYDSERHILFNSSEYKNTPFWDFHFSSTVNCTIEAQLLGSSPDVKSQDISGCAVVLIGFKN